MVNNLHDIVLVIITTKIYYTDLNSTFFLKKWRKHLISWIVSESESYYITPNPTQGRLNNVDMVSYLLRWKMVMTHFISALMCTAIKALLSGCSLHEKPWELQG